MKLISPILAFVLSISSANAALVINVTGQPGGGFTVWEFVSTTTGEASGGGTIFTSAVTGFGGGSGQFPFGAAGNVILDGSIQDQVFPVSGPAPTISVGADTRTITHVWLDDDGGSADDFGVRVSSNLTYAAGETSSWAGTTTVGLDINTFALGSHSLSAQPLTYDSVGGQTTLNFAIGAVPEPSSILLMGSGFLGFLFLRRRK